MLKVSELWAFVALALGACGGDGASKPDAAVAGDAALDAPALPAGCDYAELRDTTNDDVSPSTGTPEMTGLVFATRTVVCGTIDSTHFDGDITVDIDGFVVTLAADADVLVRIDGADIGAVELAGVDVYTGPNLSQIVGTSTVYGGHGVAAMHLPAGTYELAVFALNAAAITTPIPYTVRLSTDAPATRCPELTTGGYAEAHDGAAHDGNDMIRFAPGMPPALSPSTLDVPEPTLVTVAPATNYRLTGSAAAATTPDAYEDKDTFAFATDGTTNELAVRLNWPSTTANLDYFLFEATNPDPIVRVTTATAQQPELRTFSVKPSTSYWLTVGAKVGSTALPAAYGATVCGAAFSP